MIGEINIYGVYLPSLLAFVVMAVVIQAVLQRLIAWAGIYRFVWHRPLFDLALFVIVLGATVAAGQPALAAFIRLLTWSPAS